MPAAPLLLDPQIRDWVLFPITLVMILVGVLRHYVTQLLVSAPKRQTLLAVREQRAALRSQILRATSAHSPIPSATYKSISQHLSRAFNDGTFLKDGPPKADDPPAMPPNPLTDPTQMEGMMDGMKQQFVMMVPQMVIMGWINFFFQGFVLIKLPFPLTLGFKSMMQRGIDTQEMDARWVSSLSWYFLNLFGLNGLFRLLLGNDNGKPSYDPYKKQQFTHSISMNFLHDYSINLHLRLAADSSRDMTSSPFANAAAAQSKPAGPQDFSKIFAAEKDNLELAEGLYVWSGEHVEERLLQRWGKLPKTKTKIA